MKRFLCILLASLFLLSCVSCADNGGDGEQSDVPTGAGTEAETVDMAFVDELPELNYNDERVAFLGSGQVGAKDELYTEGRNNELINDAVYERNEVVETRLGVKLDIVADGGNDSFYVSNKIHNLVMTGTDEFQFCTLPSYVAVTRAVEGEYLDLTSFEYLDLSKHYWSQGYNEMASWGDGHQFMASGSAALTLFRYMYVTLYNKNVMTDRQIDDPFNAVQNGDWTLDFKTSLINGMYQDLNGNGKIDEKDFFGFASGYATSSDCYWISTKSTVLDKDETGYFIYNADVERITEAVDKVLALFYGPDSYVFTIDSTYDNYIIEDFGNSLAFMVDTMITKIEVSLRDFKDDYGILPIPKLNKEQKDYRTCVQDQVSAFMLPSTLPESKKEMMGAVLECLGSESYKTVVDAYYNTALSYRYLNNPESKIMLDLIYDSVSFEIAQIYTEAAGNFLANMRAMVSSKRNTAASAYKKQTRNMEKQLQKLNEKYEKVVNSQS
ncbi:MAG: hypothetical protein MJ192_09030 [Clostridia bacterium]|nr:hypothetical protein [Clostridia bacterium]